MLQQHPIKCFQLIVMLTLCYVSNATAAVITVNQNTDSGNGFCTLRQALLSASLNFAFAGCAAGEDNLVDKVLIDVAGPIVLTQGQIEIFGAVSISPVNNVLVQIKAAPNSRIFNVNSPDANDNDFSIYNLNLTDGDAGVEGGGAIRIEDAGEVLLQNSWFINNSAQNGGAIYGHASLVDDFTLSYSHFIDNSATSLGGALYGSNLVAGGLNDIIENHFDGNSADKGGAISLNDSSDTITFFGNKFTGNMASNSGGALTLSALNSQQIHVMDSNVFYNNQAIDSGGAINLSGSTTRLDLINTTLSHNYADKGGAIANISGNLQISNSTLVHNTATTTGANLYSTPNGINALEHSIVAHPINQDNCGGAGAQFFSRGTNVHDDTSCGLNEPTDTLGDPKLTGMVEEQGLFGYFPTADSPALDNNPLIICTRPGSTPNYVDQFGMSRNTDGDGDGTGQCDAGAVEAPANTDLLFYDGFGIAY